MSESPPQVPDPGPPPDLVWSGLTHVGKVRANNEDAFLALAVDGREVRYLGKTGRASLVGCDYVFAVSDGMGGAKSGEFASRFAVDRITRLFPRAFRMAASGMGVGFADVLSELIGQIHQDLTKMGQAYEECAGMGATLSLSWFTPRWMYFAHVGDSRIYALPAAGELAQVTHDHTHVGWLRRQGRINEREQRSHPRRHALQQALGAGNAFIDPHIGAVDHRPGDRFLLCSDGVTDGLWDRRVAELLQESSGDGAPRSRAQMLVEEAVEASGRDNTTAVVIEVATPAARP